MKMKKWLSYHLVGTILFVQRRLLPFISIPSLPFREQMVRKGSSRPANPNPRQVEWQQAVSTPCSAHLGKVLPPHPTPINTPDANSLWVCVLGGGGGGETSNILASLWGNGAERKLKAGQSKPQTGWVTAGCKHPLLCSPWERPPPPPPPPPPRCKHLLQMNAGLGWH